LHFIFLDREPASHEEFCGQPDERQRGHHTGPEGACAGAGTTIRCTILYIYFLFLRAKNLMANSWPMSPDIGFLRDI
jgi:hypothetical protein